MLHIKAYRISALLYAACKGTRANPQPQLLTSTLCNLGVNAKHPGFFSRAEHGKYSSCMWSLHKYAAPAKNLISDLRAFSSM